jgi:hypothetical protein
MLLEMRLDTEKLNFRSKKINLNKALVKLQNACYGSPDYRLKNNIEKELALDDTSKSLNAKKVSFKRFKYDAFIDKLNTNILLPLYKTKLTKTTIEGCLINKNSLDLFLQWLKYELLQCVNVGGNDIVQQSKIKKARKKITQGKDIANIFNCLFSANQPPEALTEAELRFIKRIKYKYLVDLIRKIKAQCASDHEILILCRLMFDGKTDTLVSIENQNSNKLDTSFVKLVRDMKKIHLKKLNYLFGKTSGWATRFLNFSIDYIDRQFPGHQPSDTIFAAEFNKIFPELYDIVTIASDSID